MGDIYPDRRIFRLEDLKQAILMGKSLFGSCWAATYEEPPDPYPSKLKTSKPPDSVLFLCEMLQQKNLISSSLLSSDPTHQDLSLPKTTTKPSDLATTTHQLQNLHQNLY